MSEISNSEFDAQFALGEDPGGEGDGSDGDSPGAILFPGGSLADAWDPSYWSPTDEVRECSIPQPSVAGPNRSTRSTGPQLQDAPHVPSPPPGPDGHADGAQKTAVAGFTGKTGPLRALGALPTARSTGFRPVTRMVSLEDTLADSDMCVDPTDGVKAVKSVMPEPDGVPAAAEEVDKWGDSVMGERGLMCVVLAG